MRNVSRTRWALLLAGLWIVQAVYFQQTGAWLGFPDGGLTDLARARKKLYLPFAGVCLAGAGVTLGLGRRSVKVPAIAFVLVTAAMWGIDLYLCSTLDDGAGG